MTKTKTKLQIMREKNEELLRANINMHDALDLKSERIQELKKQLATAVEVLKRELGAMEYVIDDEDIKGTYSERIATESAGRIKKALAEIGGKDE